MTDQDYINDIIERFDTRNLFDTLDLDSYIDDCDWIPSKVREKLHNEEIINDIFHAIIENAHRKHQDFLERIKHDL